jgi:hypothetical protein
MKKYQPFIDFQAEQDAKLTRLREEYRQMLITPPTLADILED